MADPNDFSDYPLGATPLDRDELAGIKLKYVSTKGELDHLEQSNIHDGLKWLKKQSRPDVLSEVFLRELHKRLFGKVWQWAGTYRATEKNIGIAPFRIAIEVHKLLADAKFWVDNATYKPKELAVRFHHRLVSIHPFPNGNGRHARILANAILTKVLQEPEIDWSGGFSLDHANDRRKDYIAALRAADGRDYGPLMLFVKI